VNKEEFEQTGMSVEDAYREKVGYSDDWARERAECRLIELGDAIAILQEARYGNTFDPR
jgi:hypothetical protein